MELEEHIILVKLQSLDDQLFDTIKFKTDWDNSMVSRKTVSYGIPYNYSGVKYLFYPLPHYLNHLQNIVFQHVGFLPNNCLINYYINGNSKMGFHSDQIEQLFPGTGITIISLGNPRTIRFRNKNNIEKKIDFILTENTLFYMSQEVQKYWMHAILPDKGNQQSERISITFRMLSEFN